MQTLHDLSLSAQSFEDYKSKYLDISERSKRQPGGDDLSVLKEVDFELGFTHRDEINVTYILKLL